MDRKEFILTTAKKAGADPKEVLKIYTAAIDTLAEALASGDKAALGGFGVLEVREVASAVSIDKNTGEREEVPAHKRIAFVAVKSFKDKAKLQ